MKNKYHWDVETIEILTEKHRVQQRYRENGNLDEDKLKTYCSLRNKVRKATRYQKCKEKETTDNARTNPKTFWQYINRGTKMHAGIADLETPTNGLTSNDAEKAEILATFFSSVFTKENTEDMPIIEESKMDEELRDYKIKLDEVSKKLSN